MSDSKTLVVSSADLLAEVTIYGANFRPVASGGHELREQLPPGIYRVRVRAGGGVTEKTAVLSPEGPDIVELPFERQPIDSAALLLTTRLTHGYQREGAQLMSRQVNLSLGSGSEVFLFSRGFSRRGGRYDPRVEGVRLHDSAGNVLADARNATVRRDVDDPFAGLNVRVDPGFYYASVERSDGPRLCLPIYAARDWQTQVFLMGVEDPAVTAQGTATVGHLDPSTSTVMMSRLGAGFRPGGDDEYLTEQARIALARGAVASLNDQSVDLLLRKFENPVLGLLGAHLLLANGATERRGDLQTAVGNLRRLFGGKNQPDVEAIAMRVGLRGPDDPPITTPPLLRSSWPILVEESYARADLILRGSLAARVATHVFGSGLWLVFDADVNNANPPLYPHAWIDANPGVTSTDAGELLDIVRAFNPRAGATEQPTNDPRRSAAWSLIKYSNLPRNSLEEVLEAASRAPDPSPRRVVVDEAPTEQLDRER